MDGSQQLITDVLGIGFGPSNLALAIAVEEHNQSAGTPLRAHFIERKKTFGWHQGMLIEGATMQVSFLKDLVTLRNPVSRYGFLSYLHDRGRLVSFINAKEFYPSRVEFHDYLEWASAGFDEVVEYGTEAVDARSVAGHLEVTVRDVDSGRQRVVRTRNIVFACGLRPQMPPGVERSERVWHSSELLERLERVHGTAPKSFAVVGAGQSGAEVVAHLHDVFRGAEIHSIIPRYGYSPSDDSSFANRVFDPEAVNDFYNASPAVKRKFYDYHSNTNYSVVDGDLIAELYRRFYLESVTGRRRLHMLNMSRVDSVTEQDEEVRLGVRFLPDGSSRQVRADYAVFATGYRPMDPTEILGGVIGSCKRESDGRLRVGRDYRVETGEDLNAGIYLQGGTEMSHGITSSLLSNIAVRSGEIVDSLLKRRPGAARP